MKRTRFLPVVVSALALSLLSCGDKNSSAGSGMDDTGETGPAFSGSVFEGAGEFIPCEHYFFADAEKDPNRESFAGASSDEAAQVEESKGTVGMTCMNLNNPFFQLIAQEMEKAASAAGYTLKAMDGKGDAALQNTQIDEFITQKCDAIFLNPADSKATGSGVRAAHAAGIPVFTFDIQMEDPEVQKLVTYHVGSDNYQGGRLAGESMMKATGGIGKIGIINLPEANSCKKRVDGFKDYLSENNSKLEIVAELNGKGDRVKGAEVAADMLAAHGDLVGIFGINDPCALGAWASVKEAGKLEQITIIGFDGSPDGKIGVFEKKLYDTPMQFPGQMATKTVEAFLRYVAGDEL
ncbi:MAG: sugar ABC transporter substrate-binding protein [Roseibacillus sp.]|nr:sugar ABC transporter substrate-binding protein [Roseibacillus sp.]